MRLKSMYLLDDAGRLIAEVEEILELMKRCVLGTDSGTARLPDNIAAMEAFASRLLGAGLTKKEIDLMAR